MSTMPSVGAMLPLVLMPGSGSELYRGLVAVVVGGLVVSTVFTLFLVPVILSVVFDIGPPRLGDAGDAHEALDVAVEVGHNGHMGRAKALGGVVSHLEWD
jgi:HAE1 family hydrophobic/amphiphilic exporter-1